MRRSSLLLIVGGLAAVPACSSILGDFTVASGPATQDGATDAPVDGNVADGGGGDHALPGDGSGTGDGEAGPTPPPLEVTDVAAGNSFTCAIVTYHASSGDRVVTYCFGDDASGALGNAQGDAGAGVAFVVPRVAAPLKAVASSSAANHVCGIEAASGQLWCWGANGTGQLGNNTSGGFSATPVQPIDFATGAILTAQSIAVGASHTCAVSAGATPAPFCWGANTLCQGGERDANNNCTNTPTILAPRTGTIINGLTSPTVAVAGGDASGFAAVTGGAQVLQVFGGCQHAECGFNQPPSNPFAFAVHGGPNNANIAPVSAAYGDEHGCAVGGLGAGTNQLLCWGNNDAKQVDATLGPGNFIPRLTFATIPDLPLSVAAGTHETCVVFRGATGNYVACAGANSAGQLGRDTAGQPGAEAKVPGLTDVTKVVLGGSHGCAIARGAGDPASAPRPLYCWGNGSSGQLGFTAASTTTPTKVPFPPFPP